LSSPHPQREGKRGIEKERREKKKEESFRTFSKVRRFDKKISFFSDNGKLIVYLSHKQRKKEENGNTRQNKRD
jgi:hypothetical protein